MAFGGAVHDIAEDPQGGGATAVEVHGFLAAQPRHVGGQFREGHADRQVRLTAVHHHEVPDFSPRIDSSAPPGRTVWAGYHKDMKRSPRVRAMIDFLAHELEIDPVLSGYGTKIGKRG